MDRTRDLQTLQLAGIKNIDALVHAAAQFVRDHSQVRPIVTSPLSGEEKLLLRESGAHGVDEHSEPFMQAGPVDIVGQYAQLVTAAFSTEAVAKNLGVVPSRVRQRVTARTLYAIDTSAGRVFPAFQFDVSGAVLPGLGRVLTSIDSSVHPITVERFFLSPSADLESELAGRTLSPRDWLLLALPVEEVVLLAREL